MDYAMYLLPFVRYVFKYVLIVIYKFETERRMINADALVIFSSLMHAAYSFSGMH